MSNVVRNAAGLSREFGSDAAPIRKIFKASFEVAGLPYYNPHSIRTTLVQLGEQLCSTPEEFKAWSQNLGHEQVMTTFRSYGSVPQSRQAEIIRKLGQPKVSDAELRRKLRELLAASASFLAGGIDLPQERIVRRAIELREHASFVCHRQADDALRIDLLALFANRHVVEVEKVLRAGRLQPADVAAARGAEADQCADVPFGKVGDALFSEPPVEQHRRRFCQGIEGRRGRISGTAGTGSPSSRRCARNRPAERSRRAA